MRKREMKNYYLEHLLSSLEKQKDTVKIQVGCSDIEPPDYRERVDNWFSDLVERVQNNIPSYYVRTIIVFQLNMFEIEGIEYKYYKMDDIIQTTTISIYDPNRENDS